MTNYPVRPFSVVIGHSAAAVTPPGCVALCTALDAVHEDLVGAEDVRRDVEPSCPRCGVMSSWSTPVAAHAEPARQHRQRSARLHLVDPGRCRGRTRCRSGQDVPCWRKFSRVERVVPEDALVRRRRQGRPTSFPVFGSVPWMSSYSCENGPAGWPSIPSGIAQASSERAVGERRPGGAPGTWSTG